LVNKIFKVAKLSQPASTLVAIASAGNPVSSATFSLNKKSQEESLPLGCCNKIFKVAILKKKNREVTHIGLGSN
jgi:hypothetical protein